MGVLLKLFLLLAFGLWGLEYLVRRIRRAWGGVSETPVEARCRVYRELERALREDTWPKDYDGRQMLINASVLDCLQVAPRSYRSWCILGDCLMLNQEDHNDPWVIQRVVGWRVAKELGISHNQDSWFLGDCEPPWDAIAQALRIDIFPLPRGERELPKTFILHAFCKLFPYRHALRQASA